MMIIFPDKEKETPKDWAFMEKSGEVLASMPDTWKAYPDNEAGMMSVIDMEYNELKNAMTDKDKSCELVHLASACLRMWRRLNHAE